MFKTLCSMIIIGSCLTACNSRGADDRVQVSPDAITARSLRHGPSATVVTTRKVDRVRLSGNVMIVTTGEEPIYARHAAWDEVPVHKMKERVAYNKKILEEIERIDIVMSNQIKALNARDKQQAEKEVLLGKLAAERKQHEENLRMMRTELQDVQLKVQVGEEKLSEKDEELGARSKDLKELNAALETKSEKLYTLEKEIQTTNAHLESERKKLEAREERVQRNLRYIESEKELIRQKNEKLRQQQVVETSDLERTEASDVLEEEAQSEEDVEVGTDQGVTE